MRVSQIDLAARTIGPLPGETKNDEGCMVKMTDEVYNLLLVCVGGKQLHCAVFTWEDVGPVKDFRGTWCTMTRAAKVSVLLHDFRRSAARSLLRAGLNSDVAKRSTGHKTDSMFSRYNIIVESDLAEAAG
jgi:integrase